jgi:hypothetical protein
LPTLADTLLDAIRAVVSRTPPATEAAFQAALARELGSSERELRAAFAPPAIAWRRPPQAAIDALAGKMPARVLPNEGRDPCVRGARLDILWHAQHGAVPIELKHCAVWKSDVNGYQFLKDIHRLERMIAAGAHCQLAPHRYAAFLTREPIYWRGERPEPPPFWVTDARRLERGYWVFSISPIRTF